MCNDMLDIGENGKNLIHGRPESSEQYHMCILYVYCILIIISKGLIS